MLRFLFLIFVMILSSISSPSRAESWTPNRIEGRLEVIPITAETAAGMNLVNCHCFRWSVQFGIGQGKWETLHFVVRSDALIRFAQTSNTYFIQDLSRLATFGQFEAESKFIRMGIGFEGVTWGNDLDHGYSRLVRTGVYALIRLLAEKQVGVTWKSGYRYGSYEINFAPGVDRHELFNQIQLNWDAKPFSGDVYSGISWNFLGNGPGITPWAGVRFVTGANLDWNVAKIAEADFHLGLNAQYELDRFRENFGMPSQEISGKVFMRIDFAGFQIQGNH